MPWEYRAGLKGRSGRQSQHSITCSLKGKRVNLTCCVTALPCGCFKNGVHRTVIALWLGHESVESTQMDVHADIQIKEQAMAKTTPVAVSPSRYRPNDELLAFLEGL